MSGHNTHPHAIIVMGVSGCGKSSVGVKIAQALAVEFVEGDALHPASNVEKMSKGIPLTDEDRMPWLDVKRSYRDRLRAAVDGDLFFVYLHGSDELLTRRMGERKGHFMPLSLLENQLATLEVPTGEPGVVTVDIDMTIDEIAKTALRDLKDLGVS
jgi:gluconokinase